jgi:hypothetical protein
VQCERCLGTGKAEDHFGCTACKTFGAMPCDICAGSGLASYGFFPRELSSLIATARLESAIHRLQAAAQVEPDKRATVPHYGKLLRLRAIFMNFLDQARTESPQAHTAIAKLVVRCWRGLARTEVEISHVLTDLGRDLRNQANGNELDPRFREDRMTFLEEEAVRWTQSARDRLAHIREHQHG